MEEKDKYPRVSQVQLEIWLDNPVTKNYLHCLTFASEAIGANLALSSFVDSSNNDLSMNKIHSAIGERAGLAGAMSPAYLLEKYGMVELEKEEGEEEDEG